MHDIFYQVNDKKFYNTYLAHYESFKTGSKVKFSVDQTAYDALNWLNEPEQSIQDLMAQHARRLRNQYDILILHWSGGTDSHTVYNVFRRNNIHIDEIRVIVGNELTPKFPQFFLDWIQANHDDPTTTITKIDVADVNSKQSVIDQSDWIFNNVCFMPVFAYSSFEPSDIERNNHKYGGKKWCMISGHEKPDLIFLKDSWYTRFEDKAMRQTMNPYVENFFLEPMINLKQSHLLKQAIKKLGVTVQNGQRAVDIYNITTPDSSDANYQAHAVACGRDIELLPGHSNLQKKVTKSQLQDLYFDAQGNLKINPGLADVMLKEKVLDQHPLAVKYLQGIQALHHERAFMQYLDDNNLTSQGNPLVVKSTFSKPYSIGN
jgi:hypothetical protein